MMKRQTIAKLGAGVGLALLVGSAQAVPINWLTSTQMYDAANEEGFVSTNGTGIIALSTAATAGSTNTINGVDFVTVNGDDLVAGVTYNGATMSIDAFDGNHDTAFATGSFTNTAIQNMIKSSIWDRHNVTITGLTSGEWYMLQVMVQDARGGRNTSYKSGFSDGESNFLASFAAGTHGEAKLNNSDGSGESSGDSIIGYFQADAGGTVTYEVYGTVNDFAGESGGRAQMNGFQLRQLDEEPVIPEDPPSTPVGVYTVISNMSVRVNWTASSGDEPITYAVKRAPVGETTYVTLASGLTDLSYVDTTVVAKETYDYVVSATNAIGESANSGAATGVGLPYDIIGTDPSNESLGKDNAFDKDIAVFFDDNSAFAWVGLDFGDGNALEIEAVEYTLRGPWGPAYRLSTNIVFEGADNPLFTDAVILARSDTSVQVNPAVNVASVTDTTKYRYVRARQSDNGGFISLAELNFITELDVTSNGTSLEWLDSYYDVSGSNPSNFADYAEADVSDTDGDGLEAWEEYKLNGDPTDANSPAGVNGLYAWPEAPLENVVRWDNSSLADLADGGGYVVYRSLDGSNYTALATVATNVYTDAAVSDGVAYTYAASVTNATYDHETVLSTSEMASANENQIIGTMINSNGASKVRWYYELFDRNLDSFMDDNAVGGYGGLDFGLGNGQATDEVYFRLRGDSFGKGNNASFNIVVDGETNNVSRAAYYVYGNTFEGSNDGSTWTTLATITNMVPVHGIWNSVPVASAATYQYVRYFPANGLNNFAMADVEFVSTDGYTAKGTPMFWLNEHDLTGDEVDVDSDGHESWQEFLAYTDPSDSNSVLKISSYSDTNGLSITWQSVAGVSYSVITTDSLTFGTPENIETGIIGSGGETTYTTNGVAFDEEAEFFYIGVE